jgi:isoleucyl-tRNA synthetase
MPVTEGQWWVLKKLKENNRLLHKTSITHSYPHCWRCHNGLIFRATKQWFFDLEKNNIKEKATYATYSIKAFPEKSINRLRAMVEGRLEWCLSRQRSWGVSIPAVVCVSCDTPYYNQALANRVADQVAVHGIEWWDNASIEEIMPEGFACKQCGSTHAIKEKDILDVWFDSGISHYAVLEQNPELGIPADLYLEGSDQHRGWFQSSLLTSIAMHGQAPMKQLYTHGFVVDEKGHKMSKSLGNVIAPSELIDRLGTDGLRMWAASIDSSSEAILSTIVLNNVQEVFRKVRNTLRFLLSNLYDFDASKDSVSLDQLLLIDKYALQELYEINEKIIALYQSYNTSGVFHVLGEYCATALSALYLDISKDRLYVEKATGHQRRSAQTAYYYILDTLTRLIAPIMSFTAEQVSDLYQDNKRVSIHMQSFATLATMHNITLPKNRTNNSNHTWHIIHTMRDAILKALEEKREIGLIKHPLEARVTLYSDPADPHHDTILYVYSYIESFGQTVEQFIREFAIVSQVIIAQQKNENMIESPLCKGLYIEVEHAYGVKCPRCWQWDEQPQEHNLCRRCYTVLQK